MGRQGRQSKPGQRERTFGFLTHPGRERVLHGSPLTLEKRPKNRRRIRLTKLDLADDSRRVLYEQEYDIPGWWEIQAGLQT